MSSEPNTPLTAQRITDDITRPLFTWPTKYWHAAFGTSQAMASLLVLAVALYIIEGYGIFGTNQPVNWGNDIATYIFWIANTVIDSVERLIAVRHLARNRKRIDDTSVPATAMPIQKM